MYILEEVQKREQYYKLVPHEKIDYLVGYQSTNITIFGFLKMKKSDQKEMLSLIKTPSLTYENLKSQPQK